MSEPSPSFAADPLTAAYYDRRAGEYDEWYLDQGLFAARGRAGWAEAVAVLEAVVGSLAPCRTLDVACGTGFLTRHLAGPVVAVDRSPAMAARTQERIGGRPVRGATRVAVADALALPVATGAVDRVFTGHFYGHLPPEERTRFMDEVRRVATEVVVVDSARRPEVPAEGWQWRTLNDGSRHRVYKRYLTGPQLAGELGGGQVLVDGPWFVAVRAPVVG